MSAVVLFWPNGRSLDVRRVDGEDLKKTDQIIYVVATTLLCLDWSLKNLDDHRNLTNQSRAQIFPFLRFLDCKEVNWPLSSQRSSQPSRLVARFPRLAQNWYNNGEPRLPSEELGMDGDGAPINESTGKFISDARIRNAVQLSAHALLRVIEGQGNPVGPDRVRRLLSWDSLPERDVRHIIEVGGLLELAPVGGGQHPQQGGGNAGGNYAAGGLPQNQIPPHPQQPNQGQNYQQGGYPGQQNQNPVQQQQQPRGAQAGGDYVEGGVPQPHNRQFPPQQPNLGAPQNRNHGQQRPNSQQCQPRQQDDQFPPQQFDHHGHPIDPNSQHFDHPGQQPPASGLKDPPENFQGAAARGPVSHTYNLQGGPQLRDGAWNQEMRGPYQQQPGSNNVTGQLPTSNACGPTSAGGWQQQHPAPGAYHGPHDGMNPGGPPGGPFERKASDRSPMRHPQTMHSQPSQAGYGGGMSNQCAPGYGDAHLHGGKPPPPHPNQVHGGKPPPPHPNQGWGGQKQKPVPPQQPVQRYQDESWPDYNDTGAGHRDQMMGGSGGGMEQQGGGGMGYPHPQKHQYENYPRSGMGGQPDLSGRETDAYENDNSGPHGYQRGGGTNNNPVARTPSNSGAVPAADAVPTKDVEDLARKTESLAVKSPDEALAEFIKGQLARTDLGQGRPTRLNLETIISGFISRFEGKPSKCEFDVKLLQHDQKFITGASRIIKTLTPEILLSLVSSVSSDATPYTLAAEHYRLKHANLAEEFSAALNRWGELSVNPGQIVHKQEWNLAKYTAESIESLTSELIKNCAIGLIGQALQELKVDQLNVSKNQLKKEEKEAELVLENVRAALVELEAELNPAKRILETIGKKSKTLTGAGAVGIKYLNPQARAISDVGKEMDDRGSTPEKFGTDKIREIIVEVFRLIKDYEQMGDEIKERLDLPPSDAEEDEEDDPPPAPAPVSTPGPPHLPPRDVVMDSGGSTRPPMSEGRKIPECDTTVQRSADSRGRKMGVAEEVVVLSKEHIVGMSVEEFQAFQASVAAGDAHGGFDLDSTIETSFTDARTDDSIFRSRTPLVNRRSGRSSGARRSDPLHRHSTTPRPAAQATGRKIRTGSVHRDDEGNVYEYRQDVIAQQHNRGYNRSDLQVESEGGKAKVNKRKLGTDDEGSVRFSNGYTSDFAEFYYGGKRVRLTPASDTRPERSILRQYSDGSGIMPRTMFQTSPAAESRAGADGNLEVVAEGEGDIADGSAFEEDDNTGGGRGGDAASEDGGGKAGTG